LRGSARVTQPAPERPSPGSAPGPAAWCPPSGPPSFFLLVGFPLVSRVPFLGERDRLGVPSAPAPGLVPGDQHDRLPLRVEREEQAHLGGAGHPGPELFEIMNLAAANTIDQRPAELRPAQGQLV